MLKLLTSTSDNAIVTSQATLARWTGVTLVLLCRYLFQPLIIFQDDAARLDAYRVRRFHTLLCEYGKDSISPIYNLMPAATSKHWRICYIVATHCGTIECLN